MDAASGGEGLPAADEPWQEPDPGLERPPVGETLRLRNNMSMEGSKGFRRLTGQKAEPPWGVKFTLLGSGQEEIKAGFSLSGVLVSSQTRTFSQPSGGSLWKQQLLLGPGEDDISTEVSPSLWEENGDWRHVSTLPIDPWCMSSGASSEVCGMTDRSDGGGLGEKEEEDSGVVAASL